MVTAPLRSPRWALEGASWSVWSAQVGLASLNLVPLPFLRTLPPLSRLLAPEAQRWRTAAGARGTDSEAVRAHHGPCSPPFPLRQRAGTGRATTVQVPEAIGPAGAPPLPGLWRLHLAAVPHAPLGMEVMEEISEGETLHFQAGLEDPGWEGGWDEPQKHRGKWGEGQPPFHDPTRPWPLPMRQGWDKESQTASAVSQSLSP